MAHHPERKLSPLREKIHSIIFKADTIPGKAFDIALFAFIIASVIAVMLESIKDFGGKYHNVLYVLEWIFTIFFTIEYILRIYCVYKPWKYILSFYGIIDLLAILPTYLSIFVVGTQSLMVIRTLRLLRVFRIFKLGKFLREGRVITHALRESRPKITVFLVFVLLMVIIIGSVMYLIEGGEGSDFTNIPRSIYWAIVTLTTVGYGDIAPSTAIGQFLAAIVMIMGYALIAVPTGLVSAGIINSTNGYQPQKKQTPKPEEEVSNLACRYCSQEGHDIDALYCKYCGESLLGEEE